MGVSWAFCGRFVGVLVGVLWVFYGLFVGILWALWRVLWEVFARALWGIFKGYAPPPPEVGIGSDRQGSEGSDIGSRYGEIS